MCATNYDQYNGVIKIFQNVIMGEFGRNGVVWNFVIFKILMFIFVGIF